MKNKDVGMGLDDFLSLGGHLLVRFLFHEMTSLHPPSFQRNDFSTCSSRTVHTGVSLTKATKHARN